MLPFPLRVPVFSRHCCNGCFKGQKKYDLCARLPGSIRAAVAADPDVLAVGIPSGIETHVSVWKAGDSVDGIYPGDGGDCGSGDDQYSGKLNGIAAIGIGIGLMTVVGQCMGAGRKDEAVYYVKKAFCGCGGCCHCQLSSCFCADKTGDDAGGMEPESASMCIFMMACITIVKPIVWTLSFIPAYGFRAAGDVKFTMIVSCISMWVFRVSLCIFLCRQLGFWPYRRVDWDVYRLDRQRNYIYTLGFSVKNDVPVSSAKIKFGSEHICMIS